LKAALAATLATMAPAAQVTDTAGVITSLSHSSLRALITCVASAALSGGRTLGVQVRPHVGLHAGGQRGPVVVAEAADARAGVAEVVRLTPAKSQMT